MKPPATRTVRAAGTATTTRVVRATHHATGSQRAHRGKGRHIRPLLALAAFAVGAWWLLHPAGGSGGLASTGTLRRLGHIAYRIVSDGVQAVQHSVAGDAPPNSATGTHGPHATPIPLAPMAATARRGTPHSTSAPMPTPSPIAPGAGGHRAVPPRVPTPVVLRPPPSEALLANDYQVYETWNNCGPASLSMALSYFGILRSQAALGQALRPYQNTNGDNDDKDVTMDELAHQARRDGLLAYHRPSGSIALLKRFIAAGMPVIAETVLTKDDDIGHFRVVKGYDDAAAVVVQDDSMQGHNVRFGYADFDAMWKKYNYEYLVLVPRRERQLAEAILGRNLDARAAWRAAARLDRAALAADPSNVDSRFNLSVALYYTGDYRGSVAAFERVRDRLPPRTLWYQIEPIEAYYALGDYRTVFALSDTVLNGGDRAFTQLYILRGEIDRKQGNIVAARAEFRNAVLYNVHLQAAVDALRAVP